MADLNTSRYNIKGSGSSTAALGFGGGPSPAVVANTESWNNSAWTEVNDLATARFFHSGAGSSTVALAAGGSTGSDTGATEEWSFSGLDPSTTPAADYADAITGDFYYNSSTGQFKAVNIGGAPIGSWSSGANMPLARDSHAGFGVRTANGVVSGRTTPGPNPALTTGVNTFIEYDGSSWTEKANINQQRWLAEAAGVVTSGILFSGSYPSSTNILTNVELWDGSSWTETTEVNTGRRSLGGAGITSTAALAYGGRTGPNPAMDLTESWNGSSWTEVNDLNTARAYNVGSGLVTDAIYAGGHDGSNSSGKTEIYDGTSWSETGDLNTARHSLGNSGVSTNALAFGGRASPGAPPAGNKTQTEAFNGTSWTEVADLASARYDLNAGGAPGSSTNAICTGGYDGSYYNSAEEWTAADFEIKTVTTS